MYSFIAIAGNQLVYTQKLNKTTVQQYGGPLFQRRFDIIIRFHISDQDKTKVKFIEKQKHKKINHKSHKITKIIN